MAKDIAIKYTDKNFNSLKAELIELAKNYFPDSYNDFSPTSPGMMFIEMAAYVGDILSFYQDIQIQETYLQYAKDPANLYSLAYMMGYRPKVTSAASVNLEVTQRVEAGSSPDYLPDFNDALVINENSVVSNGNQKFIIQDRVDFSYSSSFDPTEVTVFSISNNNPDVYQLKKTVRAVAGEIKTKQFTVGSAEKYLTLTLDDADILGIDSIVDSSNNTWTEVPYLGQKTVFNKTQTIGQADDLTITSVSRRFVTRLNSSGQLTIQFGPGIADTPDASIAPNPTLIGANLSNNVGFKRIDHAFDPSNFLFTNSYGVAPSNTTLTVTYVVGGGLKSNVASNTITSKDSVSLANDPEFANGTKVSTTLAFTNPEPATGGQDGDNIEEIRQNSLKSFNEQGRLVTKRDFEFRAKALPPRFGGIAKVYVTQDNTISSLNQPYNPLEIMMYILSYDINKNLISASSKLKTSLKNYLGEFMIISDQLDIRDAFVVNIGVKYEIILRPNFNSRDVLVRCTEKMKEFFNIDNWNINQPINISDIYSTLDKVKGVQTVQDIKIFNKNSTDYGSSYGEFGYDISGATKNNIVYPSYDPMIFEVKYPNQDIEGRVTTL